MKCSTVYIEMSEISARRGWRDIGAIDCEAGVKNRLCICLARKVAMNIARPILESRTRGRRAYFIFVVLHKSIAAAAVQEPICCSIRIRSGDVNRAVVVGKILDKNDVRAQACGGQTGDSKGEEMFLHRQFWIGALMRLDRVFPRGGVPISNYNTYAISLRANTRNRGWKCKRLVDTTCSQFGDSWEARSTF